MHKNIIVYFDYTKEITKKLRKEKRMKLVYGVNKLFLGGDLMKKKVLSILLVFVCLVYFA